MAVSAGMASEAVLRRLQRIGQGSITAEQGLLALSILMRGTGAAAAATALPQLAVNAFVWDTYLKNSSPAFFAEMAPELAPSQPDATSTEVRAGVVGNRKLAVAAAATVDPAAVREQVQREVAAAIQQVVGSTVGADEPLMSAGLDSLGSVEFANLLSHKLGLQASVQLVRV